MDLRQGGSHLSRERAPRTATRGLRTLRDAARGVKRPVGRRGLRCYTTADMPTRKSLPSVSKRTNLETPLCIRFRGTDVARVRRAVAQAKTGRSKWVRGVIIPHANRVLSAKRTAVPTYSTAGGPGEQICVRFPPADYQRIVEASTHQKAPSPSAWIRAIVLRHLDLKG